MVIIINDNFYIVDTIWHIWHIFSVSIEKGCLFLFSSFRFYLLRKEAYLYFAEIARYRWENDTIATIRTLFHLYSSGGNGTDFDVSCWRVPKKLFYTSPRSPSETDLNASYVFANHPSALLSPGYPPTATATPWHTFPLPFSRIKSRGVRLSQPSTIVIVTERI